MGRTVTPKYRLEITHVGIASGSQCWAGLPTAKRLAEYVASLEASLLPGGPNEHLSKSFGLENCKVHRARICRNLPGGICRNLPGEAPVVAEWVRPQEESEEEKGQR